MNLTQTRQVLSYLWSTHPGAPKLADEDKARAVASYFRVLYKYAVDDVLAAVDRACRRSPTFIPSAYEIEAVCYKTPEVTPFLPPKYYELDEQYKEYKGCYYRDLCEARVLHNLAETEDARAQHQARVDGIRARMEIEEQMHEVYHRAETMALDDYDRRQTGIALADLKALGYELLAMDASHE